jgi:hypothetical protein
LLPVLVQGFKQDHKEGVVATVGEGRSFMELTTYYDASKVYLISKVSFITSLCFYNY